MKTPTKLSSEDRRAAIIKAVRRVFAEKGFDGTTTRELADAAGISEGLLFKHFPKKEALFTAMQAACCTEEDLGIFERIKATGTVGVDAGAAGAFSGLAHHRRLQAARQRPIDSESPDAAELGRRRRIRPACCWAGSRGSGFPKSKSASWLRLPPATRWMDLCSRALSGWLTHHVAAMIMLICCRAAVGRGLSHVRTSTGGANGLVCLARHGLEGKDDHPPLQSESPGSVSMTMARAESEYPLDETIREIARTVTLDEASQRNFASGLVVLSCLADARRPRRKDRRRHRRRRKSAIRSNSRSPTTPISPAGRWRWNRSSCGSACGAIWRRSTSPRAPTSRRTIVLFIIDQRTYKAALARAEAEVAQSEARYSRLLGDQKRAEALALAKAISQEDFEKITGDVSEAAAMVKSATASREVAKLNLDFTEVKAPDQRADQPGHGDGGQHGRIGRNRRHGSHDHHVHRHHVRLFRRGRSNLGASPPTAAQIAPRHSHRAARPHQREGLSRISASSISWTTRSMPAPARCACAASFRTRTAC